MVRDLQPYPDTKDSGLEWIGRMPAHWSVTALRNRYQQCLGKMLDTKRITGEHSVPYLRNTDVQWDHVNVSDLPRMDIYPKELERYTLRRGDLIVCEGGEVGRCSIWQGELDICGFQKALHRLRPHKTERDLPRFLLYALRLAAEQGAFYDGHTSTIEHLTGEKLRAHRFPFPPANEQRGIARFLDYTNRRIHRYIRAKQELIALLEEQKQAVIHEAVTGRIDVRIGKPYSDYKPSHVEWLGDVPAHWHTKKLRQCVKSVGGMTPSMEDRRFWNGDVPWVTPKDMKREAISDSSVRVSKVALDETPLRLVAPRAVLMVVRGMILAREVPIAWTTSSVTVNQDIKALIPNEGIDAEYLARVLAAAQDALASLVDVAGHGTRRLPTERWQNLEIAVSPAIEQTCIVDFLDRVTTKIDQAISSVCREVDCLREYRTRLIADIVTGKLDVRAAAAALPEEPDDPDAAEGDCPGAAGRDDVRGDLDRRTVVPATQEAMTS